MRLSSLHRWVKTEIQTDRDVGTVFPFCSFALFGVACSVAIGNDFSSERGFIEWFGTSPVPIPL